jgi:quercetin dioxygenase-like cupin family protein
MGQPVVIPWDDARKRLHEKGFSLPFVGEETGAEVLRVHLSSINPGEAAHPPHEHDGEEIIFLISGSGMATLGETEEPMEAMAALFAPEGTRHGLRNSGDTPITYLIIRTGA